MNNALSVGTINSGNYGAETPPIGATDTSITRTNCHNKKENADFLTNNTAYANAGWTYSAKLGYVVPANIGAMFDGSYEHTVPEGAFETPVVYYQVSSVKDGKYDVRFVSGLDNIDDPTRVGFDITLKVNGKSYKLSRDYTLSDTVYAGVMANGKLVTVEAFNELANTNYTNLYTCAITGIKATDKIVIEVAAVYELEGATIVGSTVSYSFCYGVGQVSAI